MMSNEEFENYIALVSRLLQLRGKQREQISVELRDHLQTRAAELESQGENKQASLRQAIEEFGDAAAMAKNFQTVQDLKRRRWMMRFSTLSIAGVFLAALFTMSMWPGNARFGSPETSIAKTVGDEAPAQAVRPKGKQLISNSARRDAATEEALESVCNLEYEETQFSDVMTELSESFRLNFILHHSAKDAEEELVTIRLRGVSLAKGLELLLARYNAVYTIDEGVVFIISKENMNDPEFLRLKMFDCKKLVAAFPSSKAFPSPEVSGETALVNLVRSMVNPDSWQANGSGEGTLSIVRGVLIANQNESSLRKISEMLRDLRGKVLGETEEIADKKQAAKRPKAKTQKAKAKETSRHIEQFQLRISGAENRYRARKARLGDGHPAVREAKDHLLLLQASLEEQLSGPMERKVDRKAAPASKFGDDPFKDDNPFNAANAQAEDPFAAKDAP